MPRKRREDTVRCSLNCPIVDQRLRERCDQVGVKLATKSAWHCAVTSTIRRLTSPRHSRTRYLRPTKPPRAGRRAREERVRREREKHPCHGKGRGP